MDDSNEKGRRTAHAMALESSNPIRVPNFTSTGVVKEGEVVSFVGDACKDIVDFFNFCREHGLPEGCSLELDESEDDDDTELTLTIGRVRMQLSLGGYRPVACIDAHSWRSRARDIFEHGTETIDSVADELATRRQARTLLTARDLPEDARTMKRESDAVAETMCDLMDVLDDPRNWRDAIPSDVLILGRARLVKEVSA
ncbi:MAG TPA: hypothetical protein VGC27_00320 [Rhizomicrobium sp.]